MTTADLDAALARLERAGRRVDLWLRDDDAVSASPALDRLFADAARYGLPVGLAAIPAEADESLAEAVAAAGATALVHGWSHANHAPEGTKRREFGPDRPRATMLDELGRALDRAAALFGDALLPMLVPPWNRIDPALPGHLAALGYTALSTFGPAPTASPLPVLNTHLDLMDWATRRGRPLPELAGALAGLLERRLSSDEPLGLLSHHRVHDAIAWSALHDLVERLATSPAVRFACARDLAAAGRVSSAPPLVSSPTPERRP